MKIMLCTNTKLETKMKKKKKHQIGLNSALTIFSVACFLPMLLVVIVAFSSEESIRNQGFSFFPTAWSLDAFKYVASFKDQVIQSYMVTIAETVCSVVLSLLFTSMFAYTLSRKDFKLRNAFSIFLLITMLLHGGLLSQYLIYTNLYNLRNNFLVLILPTCVGAGNCIIMRTYIQGNIPDALIESAEIDGAGEVYTFFKIIFPMMKPVLAAVGFMVAITHWNEWQTAMLYIDDNSLTTLQLMLIRIEKNIEFLQTNMENLSAEEWNMLKNAPSDSARMAVLLFTIGPIMVVYPFFQKYFIKGITMGAVKG